MLYYASGEKVEFPEIRKSKYTKDFSWGFYCTNNYEQAEKWAKRNRKTPTINYYTYIEKSNLKILKFEEMNDEWLDFIAKCRSGFIHEYDIVEGPMADDTVWNFVNDYLSGDISKEIFGQLAKFKHPTHQISFHTLKALDCLKFERGEIINE
ncbi:DUF3990 domain-containing protein [Clostridium botulinum]|uniref:DUF3990 domain-containing protein n=1 Tax=Clostridium botulinum TaxID=1491 RepID=UPI001966CF31|nr:DUF3990 domain-containing protein [Clostridium botulinum]MBN1075013.1 DUF3990 domain-containing protein [Clostridium botulinum]